MRFTQLAWLAIVVVLLFGTASMGDFESPNEVAVPSKGSSKLFPFFDHGRWGYMDVQGKTVIAPQYRFGYDFKEGLALVGWEQKRGVIDAQGKVLFRIPPDWDATSRYFSDGLAFFSKGEKWGFFNPGGRVVVPPKFDDVRGFSNGLACVNTGARIKAERPRPYLFGGKWGYIDLGAGWRFPPNFRTRGIFPRTASRGSLAAQKVSSSTRKA
jgi:hypothetical protein